MQNIFNRAPQDRRGRKPSGVQFRLYVSILLLLSVWCPKEKIKCLDRHSVQVPVPPFLLPLTAVQEEKHLKGTHGCSEDICFASTHATLPLVAFLTSKEEKGRTFSHTQVPVSLGGAHSHSKQDLSALSLSLNITLLA